MSALKFAIKLILTTLVLCLVISGSAHAVVKQPVFNHPNTPQERDIVNRVKQLIDRADRRQTVRLVTYSFNMTAVANSIIRAHRRGVRVRMIVNHKVDGKQYNRVKRRLGTNPRKRSFIVKCGGSCEGVRGWGTMHSKMYLRSDGMALVGSGNLSRNGTYNHWNDLMVIEDPEVYRFLRDSFDRMVRDKPAAPRRLVTDKYWLQTGPFFGSVRNDPILELLEPVKCKGTRGKAGYKNRTQVWINMFAWGGPRGRRIARRVLELHGNGCRIAIIGGSSIGKRIGTWLERRNVRHRWHVEGKSDASHNKWVVIRGRYGNDRSAWVTIGGSRNWTDHADRRDELIIRVKDKAVANAYAREFNHMWDHYYNLT